MKMGIEKQLISIKELFETYKFIVPDYQRGYSWNNEQRDDLLKDIELISDKDYKHFTGTIVACKNPDNYYEVVDGQQRLTTIFILINQFKTLKIIHKENKEFFDYLFGRKHRKLELNKETDDFFRKCIFRDERNKGDNKSENNILEAVEQFEKWWENNTDNAETYLHTILNKLGLLFYNPANKDEVSIMFEVINNRGKALSQLEKIKNYLIYYSTKHNINLRNDINLKWGDLLRNLQKGGQVTNEQEDAFLRNCWLVYAKPAKKESYNNYRNLKEKFPIEEKYEPEIEKFFNFLLKCSEYYSALFSKGKSIHEKLRFHPALGSVMPLYLSICFWMDNNNIDNQEALELLEKLNFRVYLCPDVTKRSDKYQNILFDWAHQLYKGNIVSLKDDDGKLIDKVIAMKSDWIELNDLDKVKLFLESFIRQYCPTTTFVKSLTLDIDEEYNYYRWWGLKFFLANYEEYLAENKSETQFISNYLILSDNQNKVNDKYECEHIWANDNRRNINNSVHEKSRLGNFVLLQKGINIKARTADLGNFENIDNSKLIKTNEKCKIEVYDEFGTQLRQIIELKEFHRDARKEVENYNFWYDTRFFNYYLTINDLRETKLIAFALKRWGIDDEERKIIYKVNSKRGKKEHNKDPEHKKVFYKE